MSVVLYVVQTIGIGVIVAVVVLAAWGLLYVLVFFAPRVAAMIGIVVTLFGLGWLVTHL